MIQYCARIQEVAMATDRNPKRHLLLPLLGRLSAEDWKTVATISSIAIVLGGILGFIAVPNWMAVGTFMISAIPGGLLVAVFYIYLKRWHQGTGGG